MQTPEVRLNQSKEQPNPLSHGEASLPSLSLPRRTYYTNIALHFGLQAADLLATYTVAHVASQSGGLFLFQELNPLAAPTLEYLGWTGGAVQKLVSASVILGVSEYTRRVYGYDRANLLLRGANLAFASVAALGISQSYYATFLK